ncbi:hypothetical protein CSQ87_08515 [Bifidobacterium simiarum]|uniref:Uncharacterized protein n=1 Tax=Bifidobacterium simiarum TaxID=2045441 RepID=A0A2M9HD83_9BIFI|nr:hypothetical protein CSQ87_08515 [Bifidobacterium simiarum]
MPTSDGTVVVQPVSEYVIRYLRWFNKTTDLTFGSDDGQRIAEMIRAAFEAPERLEDFSDGSISSSEIQQIRKAIMRLQHPNDEMMNSLIREMLMHDQKFVQRCRAEAFRDLEPEISSKRQEMHQLEEAAQQQASANAALAAQEKQLRQQIEEARQRIETEQANLHDVEQEKERVLARLDEDAALRLGLRATVRFTERFTAGQSSGSAAENVLNPVRYPELGTPSAGDSIADALKHNLRQFGIVPVRQSADMNMLVDGIRSTLSATHLLAVDSMFAAPLANTLSYAVRSVPASHVSVPTDWNDSSALDDLLNDDRQRVLVLDNLFDTVNESVLFELSRAQSETIVILPVGAYGNLRLVAREIWNRIFYVPTERYAVLSQSAPTPAFAHHSESNPSVEDREILAKTKSLGPKIGNGLPTTSMILPVTIGMAGEAMGITGTGQWIAPHLTLQLSLHQGPEQAQSFANGCTDAYSCNTLLTRVWKRNGR